MLYDCQIYWSDTCNIVFALYSDSTIYHNMFEDKILVYSTLSISTIASIVNITLLFGIICFEKNHYYRTLINQLVTSMYWYGILWIICIQIPTTVRYLVVSFPSMLCSLDVILRNAFMMQVLFKSNSFLGLFGNLVSLPWKVQGNSNQIDID